MKQPTFGTHGRLAVVLLVVTALAACGGFEDKEDRAFTVGGTVTGLAGTLLLRNNGTDDLILTADGAFAFPTEVPRGDAYAVSVATQPAGQTCTVANASGTVTAPVSTVTVTCIEAGSVTIGGTVTGLTGTLVLNNNGVENLTVTTNGEFTFVTGVRIGATYAVTVADQPSGQTCTVANGSGTATARVTNVAVTCTDTGSVTIGGTVTGLMGTLVLSNNGAENLTVTRNGAFTFVTGVPIGQTYAVTVVSQPTDQNCTVANGSGTATAPVTNVAVTCTGGSFTIGGTVSGLKGTLVLSNNDAESLTITANGAFTFVTPVRDGLTYAVTIVSKPTEQNCTVANGTGTATAPVTNVAVTCVDIPKYTIGGTVTGLRGTLVLRNNGAEDLNVTTNGAFTFDTPVLDGLTYAVTVAAQPADQTCTVAGGSGTVSGANVTNIAVTCVSHAHSIGGTVSGLAGGSLQLRLTHTGNLTGTTISVTSNGAYDFDPERVDDGDSYIVTITLMPTGQVCTLVNGAGTAIGPVTDVDVTCSPVTATTYSVGGTITGLAAGGLEIEQGASNSVSLPAGSTSFTLPVELADGGEYDVGIAAQPAGQTCVITRSHGQIATQDVSNVAVACIDNVTDPIVGTYTIPALLPDSVAYLTLFADGVYVYGSVDAKDCKGHGNGTGVEYGVYDYDQSTASFTIESAVVDTNGSCGVWDEGPSFNGTLAVSGSGQDKILTLTIPGEDPIDLVPVQSTTGEIYGSFADRYHKNFWVFVPQGGADLISFNTQTQADVEPTSLGHEAGIEYACGTITGTAASGTLDPDFGDGGCDAPALDHGPVDTNGTSGLSHVAGSWSFDVDVDALSTTTFDGTRVTPN
jgi:hypothetical protein